MLVWRFINAGVGGLMKRKTPVCGLYGLVVSVIRRRVDDGISGAGKLPAAYLVCFKGEGLLSGESVPKHTNC